MKRVTPFPCPILSPAFLLGLAVSSASGLPAEQLKTTQRTNAAEPARTEHVLTVDRKIVPMDWIVIEVFNEKELTVERRVQASGTIQFPLLELVEVAGKTPAEVATLIQTRLAADYLVSPQVSVDVKEFAIKTVNVTGEVNKPGAYSLPGDQRWRVIDAIAQAGGISKLANPGKIRFTRDGKTQTLDLDKLTEQTDPSKVIWLQPGDLIKVEQRFW